MGHLDDELLDRYADGALSAEERAAAEAHLAACDRCRGELAEMRGLIATFRAVPAEPLPIDLAPRVLARVGPGRREARRRALVGLLVAQAALTVLLAAWVVPALRPIASPWVGFDPPLAELAAALIPPRLAPLAWFGSAQAALAVAALAALWLIGNRLVLAGAAARRRGEGEG